MSKQMSLSSQLPLAEQTAASETPPAPSAWLARAIATDDSLAACLVRVVLGAVMFPHGAQKTLGWFGGFGFSRTLGYFSDVLHVPTPLTLLVFAAEFLGSLALVLGLFTRVAAAGVGCVMLGAIGLVHIKIGFFMNWSGAQPGEGCEYCLLALGMVAAVLIQGGGRASLDGVLARRLRDRT